MLGKLKLNQKWFLVGLVAILIAAPNSTIVKYTTNSLDPFLFTALRFGLISIITFPYLFKAKTKLNSKNLKYALAVGVSMTIAVTVYVWAIKLSQASYVSVITLLSPIIFILLSVKLTGEKISYRSVAGITLAALGAFIVIALPIAIHQKAPLQFYPLATTLALLNTITFPLAIIFSRKANEAGLPLLAVFSISSWVVFAISVILMLTFVQITYSNIGSGLIIAIIYSGVVVALVSRILNVASYEHIGSAISSGLAYAESLLSVVIPIVILGEKLSYEVVIGGTCILLGVYIAEHRRPKSHKHFTFFRNH